MVHQQLQAHSACQWLGFSQLPFRLYQDSCICLNLQLWATNPCADLTGNRCTPQLAWSIPVTKCTWYLSDAVWTIRIQLFTNLFLEGRLGFIILLAALSSAGLMLWRHSATKLGCPRKIRLEIKVISLFFVLAMSGGTFTMFLCRSHVHTSPNKGADHSFPQLL